MQLTTGKTYHAHQAAYSFEDLGGETVTFDEVNFSFTVLEKPKKVVANDGATKKSHQTTQTPSRAKMALGTQ